MSVARIYQALPFALNHTFCLDENASHHLSRVLRVKKGDDVTLFNGEGGEYSAIITHIDKKGVSVKILSYSPREAESPIAIHLAQGIARGEKMDFIIQKAVELGVSKITPLITERCNVRLPNEREEKRLKHWQSVAISACEQSGRNRIPSILPPIALTEWVPKVESEQCFVLSPHVQAKLSPDLPPLSSITLLIGPEGGLSDQEVSYALQHGFLPLNLGPRVMRTETASIASLAILQYCFGDIG